ncbi:MAG: hypothetical protein R3E02_16245 [Blastomonas sp.]
MIKRQDAPESTVARVSDADIVAQVFPRRDVGANPRAVAEEVIRRYAAGFEEAVSKLTLRA